MPSVGTHPIGRATRMATEMSPARIRLLAGPARAIRMTSRRGRDRLRTTKGTGLAHPIRGREPPAAEAIMLISGNRMVPIGSTWTAGFIDTRPSW